MNQVERTREKERVHGLVTWLLCVVISSSTISNANKNEEVAVNEHFIRKRKTKARLLSLILALCFENFCGNILIYREEEKNARLKMISSSCKNKSSQNNEIRYWLLYLNFLLYSLAISRALIYRQKKNKLHEHTNHKIQQQQQS